MSNLLAQGPAAQRDVLAECLRNGLPFIVDDFALHGCREAPQSIRQRQPHDSVNIRPDGERSMVAANSGGARDHIDSRGQTRKFHPASGNSSDGASARREIERLHQVSGVGVSTSGPCGEPAGIRPLTHDGYTGLPGVNESTCLVDSPTDGRAHRKWIVRLFTDEIDARSWSEKK